MANVKLNNDEFSTIQKNIEDAKVKINEAMEDVWMTEFGNAYHNIITSGFLDDLYEDAKSMFRMLFGGTELVIGGAVYAGGVCAGSAAFASTTVGTVLAACGLSGPVGWVVAAALVVALLACGIYQIVKSVSSVNFKTTSKEEFARLLEQCATGEDPCFKGTENVDTKLENVRLALQNVLFKIDEFNTQYANLNAAAQEVGIKTVLGDDGTTIKGIETTITVDGQEITTTTSEAMNAFFTYNETVINAEISAEYLARTYGIDINYNDIVKNANTFMTNTITSGLYSHEFIEYVLPSYNPSSSDAKSAAAAATGLSMDQINAALSRGGIASAAILAGGLLGIPLLGQLVTSTGDTGATSGTTSPGTSPGSTTPGGTSGGSSNGGTTGGTSNNNGNNNGNNNNNENPNEKPKEEDKKDDEDPDKKDDEEKEDKPVNEIKIPDISSVDLPEKIESVYKVDFDQLAREQFEFENDFDKIMQDRADLIAQVEMQYDNGDLAGLSAKLTEFGYNSAEVSAILGSKFLTSKAVLEGTQNAMLAEKANELAKAAGVEDFESKYSARPNFASLSETDASEELTLASQDKTVVESYDKMKEKREEYTGKVKDANDALVDVNESKKTMEELKAKYEKEYGTDDTTQWSEEAAKEYSESINDYNDKVEAANDKVKELEEAQKAYEEANKEFTTNKENFLKYGSLENVHGATATESGVTVDGVALDNSGVTVDGTGINSINVGGLDDIVVTPDMNGVVVDGVAQTSSTVATQNVATTMNINSGIDQNMINGAAMLSSTEQILNSLKEEGENLISVQQ